MSKRTNIIMNTITNSTTRLNIYDLFGDNLLLNSKDKKKNKSINKDNNNIFFEKELITRYTNFQPIILDLAIHINLNFNSILPSLHIIVIYLILQKLKPKKARPNTNR